MTQDIQRHFERAAECIEDARVLIENDRLAAAVGRIYYAMFHAATGALLAKGIERRSHYGLLSVFAEQFVKTKQMPRESFDHLRKAFERRQQTDYDPVVDVDPQMVQESLDHATDFVADCKDLTV